MQHTLWVTYFAFAWHFINCRHGGVETNDIMYLAWDGCGLSDRCQNSKLQPVNHAKSTLISPMEPNKLARTSKRKSVPTQPCLSTDRVIRQLKMKLIFFVTLGVILSHLNADSSAVDVVQNIEKASVESTEQFSRYFRFQFFISSFSFKQKKN